MWGSWSTRRRPELSDESDCYQVPSDEPIPHYLPRARRSSRSTTHVERRGKVRDPFPVAQTITEASRTPSILQCHDLSPGGFSYWTDCPPRVGQALSIELGLEPPLWPLAAEVRHVTAVQTLRLWLVGCRVRGTR